MVEIRCAFCEGEIPLRHEERTVVITIEREEDGAAVWDEYWAHEKCLPKELSNG